MMEKREVTQEQAEKWIRDVPGHEVEFDPDEAELCGAFREDALDEEDAIEAALDQEI